MGAPSPSLRAAGLLAFLVFASRGLSCGGESPPAPRALTELERLAFVPAGSSRLEGYVGRHADCSLESALVVDRFEFTRGDWLFYDAEGARRSAERFHGSTLVRLDESARDLPAFLSYEEASVLAERRGMRLLSGKEWVHVAVGRRSLVYPYGGLQPQKSWANTLELGFGAPTPVGTFESGKSRRYDCYDLLGNVWEWVENAVPGYTDVPTTERWEELEADGLASVVGGAFDSRSRRTFGRWPLRFHAMLLDRSTVAPSIGARMAAPADAYLWAHAEDWGQGDEVRARVRAVGARWCSTTGRELVLPFLEELAAREGASRGLVWLVEGARGPGKR